MVFQQIKAHIVTNFGSWHGKNVQEYVQKLHRAHFD